MSKKTLCHEINCNLKLLLQPITAKLLYVRVKSNIFDFTIKNEHSVWPKNYPESFGNQFERFNTSAHITLK